MKKTIKKQKRKINKKRLKKPLPVEIVDTKQAISRVASVSRYANKQPQYINK